MDIVYPVLIFGGIGLVLGVVLVVVFRLFEVKEDERVQAVIDVLPNINCGACGFSGCTEYAQSVVAGTAGANLCRAGGAETAQQIAEILGTEAGDVVAYKAFVRCHGTQENSKEKFNFGGYESCAQAVRYYAGDKRCRFACLGYGDCARVCPECAITVANGAAAVNRGLCTGCGLCAGTCPVKVISLVRADEPVLVRCSSHEAGKAVKDACAAGCLSCGICVKKCPEGAIELKDKLAVINPEKCTGCGICAQACPTKAILPLLG